MDLLNAIKLGSMGYKPNEIKKIKESGIDSKEIIKLAENGYTAADVDELIKLTSDDKADALQPGNEENKVPDKTPGTDGDKSEFNINKEEMQAKDKEIEDLKKQVANLQEAFSRKDRSGEMDHQTNRDQVREIFRTIY